MHVEFVPHVPSTVKNISVPSQTHVSSSTVCCTWLKLQLIIFKATYNL
jgi:hypothetical protein